MSLKSYVLIAFALFFFSSIAAYASDAARDEACSWYYQKSELIMNFEHDSVDEHKALVSQYFTEPGFKKFVGALEKSQQLEYIEATELNLSLNHTTHKQVTDLHKDKHGSDDVYVVKIQSAIEYKDPATSEVTKSLPVDLFAKLVMVSKDNFKILQWLSLPTDNISVDNYAFITDAPLHDCQ